MKYHPQSDMNCLAYALFNIGAVNREALELYEKATRANGGMPTFKQQREWTGEYVPRLTPVIAESENSYTVAMDDLGDEAFAKGTGVALLWQGDATGKFPAMMATGAHAVSFERGMVLDPMQDAPGKPESVEEFRKRWKAEGIAVHFWNVTKIPARERRNIERKPAQNPLLAV